MLNANNTFSLIDDFLFEDAMDREVIGAILEDKMNKQTGKIVPDTAGVDKYFVEIFITERLSYDFFVIARAYMKRHFSKLEEFDALAVLSNCEPSKTDPELALQTRILSIIYKAARAGDAYSVALMKNLFKTYHKEEYKQLKRFRKISVQEILAICRNNQGQTDAGQMIRILGMCPLYGIELHENCSILYIALNRKRSIDDAEREVEYYSFPEGLFQECVQQVDEWYRTASMSAKESFEIEKVYWETDFFVARCLERYGYPEDYVYRCNDEFYGKKESLAQTLALLKSVYPKKTFSFEEVQLHAHLYEAISALVCVCDNYDENIHELLGIGADRHELDGTECLFKPEDILDEKENQRQPVKSITLAPTSDRTASKEDYLEEIAELRKRLREKEVEGKHFKAQYDQAKNALNEAKALIGKYENDREELIALRNHVYNLTQMDISDSSENLDVMKKQIARRNVVIVGGHTNWVNKLKKEFPEWKFFDAGISRLNESMILEKTEKLYFFTNHISHGTYGKYIALVRENNIPFGYLHAVNIETIVKQIYKDLSKGTIKNSNG